MQFSGLQVTAWVVVLMGTGCLIGALLTDFWSIHHPQHSIDDLRMHRGLFKQCITTVHQSTCQFRFTNLINRINNFIDLGFTQRSMAYEQQPLQGFEVVTVVLLIIAQFLSTFVLICGPYWCSRWKRMSLYSTLLITILTTTSCVIYAVYNSRGLTFTLRQTIYQDVFNFDFGSDINELSWSFYLAAIAVVFFISSVLLSACSKPPIEYEVVSVV
ncbi:unnamed protein product, partial [Mesorhabditis belari]